MDNMDRQDLLNSFVNEVLNPQTKKNKHPKHVVLRKEGDVAVFETKPFTIVSDAIEVPTGKTGFPKGSVTSGTLPRVKR